MVGDALHHAVNQVVLKGDETSPGLNLSFERSDHQPTEKDLLERLSEAYFAGEESFFTEWKQGNTPSKKPRNPAFGGVFF